MSALPPKAEVETHGADVRYVPLAEVGGVQYLATIWLIAMPAEEPSTASKADLTPRSTLIRTIPDLALSRQEEAFALAGSELARHDGPGVIDQILGCLEHIEYPGSKVFRSRHIGRRADIRCGRFVLNGHSQTGHSETWIARKL